MNVPPEFRWCPLPAEWRSRACEVPRSILLEGSLPSASEHRSLLFTGAEEVLSAGESNDLPALFEAIEAVLAQGKWVAGYVAYEAGAHFLDLPPMRCPGPLATFGVYDPPAIFDHYAPPSTVEEEAPKLRMALLPTLSIAEYERSIQRIKDWIAAGDTYQVNFTMPLESPCDHAPLEVYGALRAQQQSSYGALCTLDAERTILSFSPELFFRVTRDGTITTKPMKGTSPRGRTSAEDVALAEALRSDEKNRAEHVMIVDLLRNDLNRICRTGTVRTDDLFQVEQYSTLHQMTSRVSGMLHETAGWYEVFRALFPGGSITGAPKRHTTELITKVEGTPRGVYTGAIGYIAPDRTACFNIAIRTAVLQQGQVTLGVGGGIVADSTAPAEYSEALLKSAFAQRASSPLQLIETMRLERGSIRLLDLHLQRLAASAGALGFQFPADDIARHIGLAITHTTTPQRLRLLLHRDGNCAIARTEAPSWPPALHLQLSAIRTDRARPHLRHKTTFRPEYDAAYRNATTANFDDALFENGDGELTEGCIATLLVQIDGVWYTPPIGSGVLPGVLRSHLLAAGSIHERVLTLHDLQRSGGAALCNALRGIAPIATVQLPSGERVAWTGRPALPSW